MRIVLDTNILARATPGPDSLSREIVRRCRQDPHVLILSPFMLAELSRVLCYDRLRRIHGLDDEGIRRYVFDLQSAALLVDQTSGIGEVVPHDPDDDPVIAAAVSGQAEVICTLDRHLRNADVQRYCAARGIRVLTDVELMQELRAGDTPAAK